MVPLANNLGDLAAESSIVVPVIITQIGASTQRGLEHCRATNWHVFTPTQSNYYTTPIYVYNANPNNCIISSTPVVNVATAAVAAVAAVAAAARWWRCRVAAGRPMWPRPVTVLRRR